MITKEQIKKLKQGDPIIIHGTFEGIVADGDICVRSPMTFYSAVRSSDIRYVPPSAVSIVEPQPDLCRKFKKGDKVQPRSGKTVLASEYGFVTFHELTGQYEVNDDEARGTVTLIVNGHACFVSAFALELVTPVEELEPFYVEEQDACYVVGKRQEDPETEYIAGFSKNRHTNAKAAAEAECKRLNAEWRKEHNND